MPMRVRALAVCSLSDRRRRCAWSTAILCGTKPWHTPLSITCLPITTIPPPTRCSSLSIPSSGATKCSRWKIWRICSIERRRLTLRKTHSNSNTKVPAPESSTMIIRNGKDTSSSSKSMTVSITIISLRAIPSIPKSRPNLPNSVHWATR